MGREFPERNQGQVDRLESRLSYYLLEVKPLVAITVSRLLPMSHDCDMPSKCLCSLNSPFEIDHLVHTQLHKFANALDRPRVYWQTPAFLRQFSGQLGHSSISQPKRELPQQRESWGFPSPKPWTMPCGLGTIFPRICNATANRACHIIPSYIRQTR